MLPPKVLTPNFLQHVTNDLSNAYAVVFVVAVCLVLATLIPAAFLSKKPALALAQEQPGVRSAPALTH